MLSNRCLFSYSVQTDRPTHNSTLKKTCNWSWGGNSFSIYSTCCTSMKTWIWLYSTHIKSRVWCHVSNPAVRCSGSDRDPVSKKKKWRMIEENGRWPLTSTTCMWAYFHGHLYTCVHIICFICSQRIIKKKDICNCWMDISDLQIDLVSLHWFINTAREMHYFIPLFSLWQSAV